MRACRVTGLALSKASGRAANPRKSPARQAGRFETEWLATDENLVALRELSGAWINQVHERKPPKTIVLDMYSSESPIYGEQEGSA